MSEAAEELEPASEVVQPRPPRPWVRRILLGMLAGVLVAVLIPVAWVFPYFRDDYVLDGVVRAVALDWRDFGREKAQARLEYELDARGVGLWVGDDDCRLETGQGADRVLCEWGVELQVPIAEVALPLAFRSVASIDGEGRLVP